MAAADKEMIEESKQAIAGTKSLIDELQKSVRDIYEIIDTQKGILEKQRKYLENLESKSQLN